MTNCYSFVSPLSLSSRLRTFYSSNQIEKIASLIRIHSLGPDLFGAAQKSQSRLSVLYDKKIRNYLIRATQKCALETLTNNCIVCMCWRSKIASIFHFIFFSFFAIAQRRAIGTKLFMSERSLREARKSSFTPLNFFSLVFFRVETIKILHMFEVALIEFFRQMIKKLRAPSTNVKNCKPAGEKTAISIIYIHQTSGERKIKAKHIYNKNMKKSGKKFCLHRLIQHS